MIKDGEYHTLSVLNGGLPGDILIKNENSVQWKSCSEIIARISFMNVINLKNNDHIKFDEIIHKKGDDIILDTNSIYTKNPEFPSVGRIILNNRGDFLLEASIDCFQVENKNTELFIGWYNITDRENIGILQHYILKSVDGPNYSGNIKIIEKISIEYPIIIELKLKSESNNNLFKNIKTAYVNIKQL